MNRLVLTAAIGLILAGGAFSASAQTATNTTTPTAAKAKKTKAAKTAEPAAKPATTTTAAAKPAAATAKPATTAAATTTAPKGHGGGVKMADRTPISIECSKQADAKGLHGKERQKFREGCMKPAK
jgi:hypothetical protein